VVCVWSEGERTASAAAVPEGQRSVIRPYIFFSFGRGGVGLPIMPRFPNCGYKVPHPRPARVTYRLNIFLGLLSKNLPTMVSMTNAPMFKIFPAAIPRP
jgi:hypothetical protein